MEQVKSQKEYYAKYARRLCKKGRILAHNAGRNLYEQISKYLTEEEQMITRKALCSLGTVGVDWESRGTFIGELLDIKNSTNDIPIEVFSHFVAEECRKRLETVDDTYYDVTQNKVYTKKR